VWFLFAAIGVALSWVVAYGWGLAKGAELTRRAQARLHDVLRSTTEVAIAAHARERTARQALEQVARSSLDPQHDAQLPAHDADLRSLMEPPFSTATRSPLSEASRAAELASAQTQDALARLSAALGEDATPRERAAPEQAHRSVTPTGEKGSSER